MSNTGLTSVVDYLRLPNSSVHKEHLTMIRDCYQRTLHLSDDIPLPEDPNDEAIREVARQLDLSIDTEESVEYLGECVRYQDINDAITVVEAKLVGEIKPIDDIIFQPACPLPPSNGLRPHVEQESVVINDINCLLSFKILNDEVQQFIDSFLLHDIKALQKQATT